MPKNSALFITLLRYEDGLSISQYPFYSIVATPFFGTLQTGGSCTYLKCPFITLNVENLYLKIMVINNKMKNDDEMYFSVDDVLQKSVTILIITYSEPFFLAKLLKLEIHTYFTIKKFNWVIFVTLPLIEIMALLFI